MKNTVIVLTLLVSSFYAFSQNNQIKRIPQVGKDVNQEIYTEYDRGFWVAAEFLGGYSSHLSGHNMGVGELDLTVGYRMNQFLKFGVGLGARSYIEQKHLRRHKSSWGLPIFVAARGNMIPGLYRKVVPYWGMEIGGSVRDGFMFRPSVGMRIGEPRQAFTLAFSYMGQNIATADISGDRVGKFTSFFCIRLGYEY
ncbi:MAG: hypothetical protein K2K08_00770 [Paramuribaculum sp.]|nr:hypothetical protein [Paramuribaculum sp.]